MKIKTKKTKDGLLLVACRETRKDTTAYEAAEELGARSAGAQRNRGTSRLGGRRSRAALQAHVPYSGEKPAQVSGLQRSINAAVAVAKKQSKPVRDAILNQLSTRERASLSDNLRTTTARTDEQQSADLDTRCRIANTLCNRRLRGRRRDYPSGRFGCGLQLNTTSKVTTSEFAARSTFQIFLELASFRFRFESDSRFDFPRFMLCCM